MANICPRCGKDMGLVGRIHRCVPRDVVTIKTHLSEAYKAMDQKMKDSFIRDHAKPKVTEIPPEWTYDKPKPVTLPPKAVTLRKAGVTLHKSHPDCPVCKELGGELLAVLGDALAAKGKKSTP